jgi:CHASE2 domain-containing sensor protein
VAKIVARLQDLSNSERPKRFLHAPGRVIALAVVSVALLLRALDLGVVAESRLRGFDLEQRLWPRSSDPAQVAIVDIDEKSLARYGQWPWPWTLVAELVRRIAEGRPRVLGIDIVFAERDRLSPPAIARELPDLPGPLAEGLAQLPPNEQVLAAAMRAVPTVLALAPGREDTTASLSSVRPVGHAPARRPLPSRPGQALPPNRRDRARQRESRNRDDDVPRDGNGFLAQASEADMTNSGKVEPACSASAKILGARR